MVDVCIMGKSFGGKANQDASEQIAGGRFRCAWQSTRGKTMCRKLETHHLNLCCRDSELGHADSDPGFRDSESVFFDSASEIIDLRLNYSFLCER